MAPNNRSFVTPRDVARVFFRHRRKIALTFGGVVGLTLLIIALYPRAFSSEAKLFIRIGRQSVTLDPTATTGQTVMLQKSQDEEVKSALEILSSREVLQQVATRVGAERILDDARAQGAPSADSSNWSKRLYAVTEGASSWIHSAMRNLRLSDPGTEMDLAIRQLERRTRVSAPKGSTVITLAYSAGSPELAREVVHELTDAFQDEHVRLNNTEGSHEFFAEQAEAGERELDTAEGELRDRKNQFQLASADSKRSILEEQIRNVELQILDVQREVAFSQAKIAELTQVIAGMAPEHVTERRSGYPNEARDRMREKLYALELQERELASRYTDNHPLLKQMREQRSEAESILTDLPDDRMQTTASLNSNQRVLELELLQAKANVDALLARQSTAKEQHSKLYGDWQALNEPAFELEQLERNVDVLKEKYRMHVSKLEEARINEEMGRGRITNIRVAQPATLVHKPVAPRKALLLLFGVTLAVGGSFGLAFVAENLDQTFRTSDQVVAQLGLPVLMSLPYRKARRGRRSKRSGSVSDAVASKERNGHSQLDRYRTLAMELLSNSSNGSRHIKTVGIIGCETSRTRSRVAADLAIQAASTGNERVLLIDADARRRRVAKRFHINGSPGWRDVLSGTADAESCLHHRPNFENLSIMCPGSTNGRGTSRLANHMPRVATNGHALETNGHALAPVGQAIATNGHAHGANGHETNGHETNGHETNGHETNGHETNGHETNGHSHESNGHSTAGRPRPGILGQLDGLKAGYGLVVVDLPPARELDAPSAPAEWLDETVLVIEAERTRIQTAQRVKETLERAGVRVTGVIMANRREHIPRWLYQRL